MGDGIAHLFVVGIAHGDAGEKLVGECGIARESRSEAEEFAIGKGIAEEALILSTCNRVEFYFASKNKNFDFLDAARQLFLFSGKKPKTYLDFKNSAFALCDEDAVEHIFSVASGLKSQITGETEIFGQVKDAYARAFESGHCGQVLNRVFQKAAQCGKWIRTNTEVGRGKITIGSVSAELAARIFEDEKSASILLLGSGEAGKSVAEALYVRGCKDVTVASRTRENAMRLAESSDMKYEDFSDALAELENFDIVICASASPTPPLSLEIVEEAAKRRPGKSVFIIDLGVPRNCDPACEAIEGVYVYTLDDLSRIANKNLDSRKSEMEKAKAEIRRRAENLTKKLFVESQQ